MHAKPVLIASAVAGVVIVVAVFLAQNKEESGELVALPPVTPQAVSGGSTEPVPVVEKPTPSTTPSTMVNAEPQTESKQTPPTAPAPSLKVTAQPTPSSAPVVVETPSEAVRNFMAALASNNVAQTKKYVTAALLIKFSSSGMADSELPAGLQSIFPRNAKIVDEAIRDVAHAVVELVHDLPEPQWEDTDGDGEPNPTKATTLLPLAKENGVWKMELDKMEYGSL